MMSFVSHGGGLAGSSIFSGAVAKLRDLQTNLQPIPPAGGWFASSMRNPIMTRNIASEALALALTIAAIVTVFAIGYGI